MRNISYLFMALLTAFLFSCKPSNKSADEQKDPSEIDLPVTELSGKEPVLTDGTHCYQYTMKRDTYTIDITVTGNAVTGRMAFDNYEKDSSEGFVAGTLNDDILNINYRFNSEGMSSVRNINLKVRGKMLITGIGEEEVVGDSAFIKDPSTIKYEGLIYSKVDCK